MLALTVWTCVIIIIQYFIEDYNETILTLNTFKTKVKHFPLIKLNFILRNQSRYIWAACLF